MVHIDPIYPICYQERESVHHLTMHFCLAKDCWMLTPLSFPRQHDYVISWISRVVQFYSHDKAYMIIMIC